MVSNSCFKKKLPLLVFVSENDENVKYLTRNKDRGFSINSVTEHFLLILV